jgi:hypothetical protein
MKTDRFAFIRVIRGPFLNAAEEQEDQDYQNDKPETSAGPIAPISAIGPRWDCAY